MCPREGTQAKRRAHATLIDHLIPPMARAESDGDITRLEQLLDEHASIAAMVDYLFGYDATAGVVADWMYAKLAEAYVLDPQLRKFFAESNPWALHGIAERLLEAVQRKMWQHPEPELLAALQQAYLDTEGDLEGGTVGAAVAVTGSARA